MPIKIYLASNRDEEIAFICGDDWELPSQIEALEAWLKENPENPHGGNECAADLGFHVRPGAFGYGAAISIEMMRMMLAFPMNLVLSEYPADWNEWVASRN